MIILKCNWKPGETYLSTYEVKRLFNLEAGWMEESGEIFQDVSAQIVFESL